MGSQKQIFMKNIGTIVSKLSMPKKKKKIIFPCPKSFNRVVAYFM